MLKKYRRFNVFLPPKDVSRRLLSAPPLAGTRMKHM